MIKKREKISEIVKNIISVKEFADAVNTFYEPKSVISWAGLNIVVKQHLSLSEVAKFVDVCVKACFDSEDGKFTPEAKDPAIRSCIVAFYTNITLPENIESQYELIYHSYILDTIIKEIDRNQLDAILQAINEKTEHLAQANIEAIYSQMNKEYNALSNLYTQVSEAFKDVSPADIKAFLGAVGKNGNFDEEKIAKACLKEIKQENK